LRLFSRLRRVPVASWDQLKALVSSRCTHLTFAVDAFASLTGYPFISGAAQRLLFVLDTLNRFRSCFDMDAVSARLKVMRCIATTSRVGRGTVDVGALFTDSSDEEKRQFETEMAFKPPLDARQTLSVHGTGRFRRRSYVYTFPGPVRADELLYIV